MCYCLSELADILKEVIFPTFLQIANELTTNLQCHVYTTFTVKTCKSNTRSVIQWPWDNVGSLEVCNYIYIQSWWRIRASTQTPFTFKQFVMTDTR